ncbi:hypothetical protein RsTz2092_10440 [Deferribacterales bacterium RsTz2092]|nr:hypothetical protein AGMMS49941_08870 [Deferribacterales bacterium]
MLLRFHVLLEILGTLFFVVAFIMGLIYCLAERSLKNRQLGGRLLSRISSLSAVDRFNTRSLYAGFVSYTLGIIVAVGWIITTPIIVWSNELISKIVIALFVWLVVLATIIVKHRHRLSARQTALASITGFISVIVVYGTVVYFVAGI